MVYFGWRAAIVVELVVGKGAGERFWQWSGSEVGRAARDWLRELHAGTHCSSEVDFEGMG